MLHNRATGQAGPPLRFSESILTEGITDPHDFVDTCSTTWKLNDVQADDILRTAQALLPGFRKCGCDFCAHHEDVHEAVDLTTAEGLTVRVDATLHPLLSTLAAHGIRTTDSCADFHGAVQQIDAHQLAPLMNGATRGTLNYETVLRHRAAFIWIRNDNDHERAFITAAGQLDGVIVETVSLLTQLVFPLDRADELAALAM